MHHSRRLIGLRRRFPVLRTGSMSMVTAKDGLLVFWRGEGSEGLLCVFNLGHDPIEWSPPMGWQVVEAVNAPDPAAGTLPPLAGLLLAQVAG